MTRGGARGRTGPGWQRGVREEARGGEGREGGVSLGNVGQVCVGCRFQFWGLR